MVYLSIILLSRPRTVIFWWILIEYCLAHLVVVDSGITLVISLMHGLWYDDNETPQLLSACMASHIDHLLDSSCMVWNTWHSVVSYALSLSCWCGMRLPDLKPLYLLWTCRLLHWDNLHLIFCMVKSTWHDHLLFSSYTRFLSWISWHIPAVQMVSFFSTLVLFSIWLIISGWWWHGWWLEDEHLMWLCMLEMYSLWGVHHTCFPLWLGDHHFWAT